MFQSVQSIHFQNMHLSEGQMLANLALLTVCVIKNLAKTSSNQEKQNLLIIFD